MDRHKQFRGQRQEIYESLFTAQALCLTGIIIIPALLFNPSTPLRVLQFLFFWFLAWLSGKKNNPLITILFLLFIVAFNLIIPFGRVLFSIGVFKITSGALEAGIQRAVTLLGLIMLSRFTIRRDLKIPGFFGELIGESFRIFALITEKKPHFSLIQRSLSRSWKNLIDSIDRLMLDLSNDNTEAGCPAAIPAPRQKKAGYALLAVIAILSWLPITFNFI